MTDLTNGSVSEETVKAYSGIPVTCNDVTASVSVAYCPGGFYIYKPLTHPQADTGYVTCEWHLL